MGRISADLPDELEKQLRIKTVQKFGGSYEGRRGHGKGSKRYPVQLGEELEVDITEYSPKEEGIAKVQGLVVYVPNAKPGNHVKIKISHIDGKTAKAQIIQ